VARPSTRITLASRVIEGRIGPGGKRVYRARVYYRGRYVASRTFPRKRDAQEWERRQVESLRSGVWSDPTAGDRPVREWCEIWLNAQPARQPATERKIRGVIAKQIAETFGRRPLVSVRPSEVQAWAAELSRTQSAATARHSLGVLRRVFDYAVRDGVIQRNPAAGIRLSKVQGNDPRPLTHDDLWRLAGQFDAARDRLLVLVAGYCGLRWGSWRHCGGPTSTCKAGPCAWFGRIRRRHPEASCRRSRTTRHAPCRFPRSCRASSQTTKPSATQMDLCFLPKKAPLCATVTGDVTFSIPRSRCWDEESRRTTCATPPHRWPSRKVPQSSLSRACSVTNQRRQR